MKHRISKNRQARFGFTLIEVLVATVVMIILVGLVIQITSQVLNVWNRSSGRLSANAEARIAMELLTQDLESAILRNNGQQWLRVEGPLATASQYNGQTVSLKLFAPALDRDKSVSGDICAIGYRLAYQSSYDTAGSGNQVFALYRNIERPDDTFNNVMGVGSTSPQLSLTGSIWDDSHITRTVNYLASNIVDFKVIVYLSDDPNGDPYNANPQTLDILSGRDFAYGGPVV